VCEAEWSEAAGFGLLQKEAFVEAATHAHGRVSYTGLEPTSLTEDSNRPQARLLLLLTRSGLAFGQAALCLSGGGAVALYHLGLVHELL
jgi:predicted acylesterase/phospholipase RssA